MFQELKSLMLSEAFVWSLQEVTCNPGGVHIFRIQNLGLCFSKDDFAFSFWMYMEKLKSNENI
jgi:hypothetical protein